MSIWNTFIENLIRKFKRSINNTNKTKTPFTKPFLTSDQKERKSKLKSGFPDMIPEKLLLGIDPLKLL